MIMLGIIAEVIGSVIGGFLTATLLCWLFWNALKLVRHPEWGPPLSLVALVWVAGHALETSDYLHMVIFFGVLISLGVWAEGKAWRLRRATAHRGVTPLQRSWFRDDMWPPEG